MKKILKKMYKILMALGILLITIKNRVFAVHITPAYGIDYVEPRKIDEIRKIALNLDYGKIISCIAIPILWLIGVFVYWNKSKKDKKKKIKVLAIMTFSIIAIMLIIVGIIIFKMLR